MIEDRLVTGNLGSASSEMSIDLATPVSGASSAEILAVDVSRAEYNIHDGNRFLDFSYGRSAGTVIAVDVISGGSGYPDRVPPLSSTGVNRENGLQETSLIERNLGVSFVYRGVNVNFKDAPYIKLLITSGVVQTAQVMTTHPLGFTPRTFDERPTIVMNRPYDHDYMLSYSLYHNVRQFTMHIGGVAFPVPAGMYSAETLVAALNTAVRRTINEFKVSVGADEYTIPGGAYTTQSLVDALNLSVKGVVFAVNNEHVEVSGTVAFSCPVQVGTFPATLTGTVRSPTAPHTGPPVSFSLSGGGNVRITNSGPLVTFSAPTLVGTFATPITGVVTSTTSPSLDAVFEIASNSIVYKSPREVLAVADPVAVAKYVDDGLQGAMNVEYEAATDSLRFYGNTGFQLRANQHSLLNILDSPLNPSIQAAGDTWTTNSQLVSSVNEAKFARGRFKAVLTAMKSGAASGSAAVLRAQINPVLTAELRPGRYEIGTVVHRPIVDKRQASTTAQLQSKVSRRQAATGLIKEIQDAMNLAWLSHQGRLLGQRRYDHEDPMSASGFASALPTKCAHDNISAAADFTGGLGTTPTVDIKFLVSLENETTVVENFDSQDITSVYDLAHNSSTNTRVRIGTIEAMGAALTTSNRLSRLADLDREQQFQLLFETGPNSARSVHGTLGFERKDYKVPTVYLHRQYKPMTTPQLLVQYFPMYGFLAPHPYRMESDPSIVELELSFNGGSVGPLDAFIVLDGVPRAEHITSDGSWYTTVRQVSRATGNPDYLSWLSMLESATPDPTNLGTVTDTTRATLGTRLMHVPSCCKTSKVLKGADFGTKRLAIDGRTTIHSVKARFVDGDRSFYAGGRVNILLRFT